MASHVLQGERSMSTSLRLSALLATALLVACGSSDEDPEPQPKPQPKPAQGFDLSKLQSAEAKPLVLDGRAVIAAGQPGSASYEFARGFSQKDAKEPGLLVTAGSLDNLHAVAWGAAHAGVVQADVLSDPRLGTLRQQVEFALPVCQAEVYVVTKPGAKLLDLANQKIGVGPAGSGNAITAENLLWAGGVYDCSLVQGELSAQLDAVAKGELGAVIAVGGQPLTAMIGRSDVAALSLDAELVAKLAELDADYAKATIAKEHGGPAETVGVPLVLVAAAGFDRSSLSWTSEGVSHPKVGEAWMGKDLNADGLATREGPAFVLRDPELPLRLAGGSEDAYAAAAGALERAWEASDAQIELVPTAGALDNLALVAAGQAELALVPEDVLREALTRPQTAPLLARVRVLAPLFSQAIYLVQAEGGELSDAASLRRKELALGAACSGLNTSARRLLRLMRVLPEHYTGYLTGPKDAWFRLGAPEGGQVAIDLGEPEGYVAATGGGVTTRVHLVCRRDLPADQAAALVSALYAQRKNLSGVDERFGQLDPAQLGELPEKVTLHAGATQAQEAGLEPDSADPWD